MTTTLDPLERVDPARLAHLQEAVARAAERKGILDVAYRTVDTPVGVLLLAATVRGIVRVAFEGENHDAVLAGLAERVSPRILKAPERVDAAAQQLDEYFAGRRTKFDLPVDLSLSQGFRLRVLQHLTDIGFGHTESYSEVAAATGNPKAVRAVGSACATNPLPVIVPCHRVLRSDGSLGGYLGGLDAKRTLLGLESTA